MLVLTALVRKLHVIRMIQQLQHIAQTLQTAQQPAVREHDLPVVAVGRTAFRHDAVVRIPFRTCGADFADDPAARPQHFAQITFDK